MSRERKYACTVIILFLISVSTYAQYFNTGQDPASVHWRQIRAPKFQIIYPSAFEHKAQYLANILDLVAKVETKTLPSKVPRIPVVIHSSSSTSNGITVWAPKRIELYSNPPQSIYPEEWLEQLAVHEYRHAVQINSVNIGFTKVLSWLLGQQARAAVLGLFFPPWFLEGDAVSTETALTNSGRGRTPGFEKELRAQLLEKGIYSYDRAVLGSYRVFIPDRYQLGYPLVAQARRTYGPDIWNCSVKRAANFPFMVVPFSSGIHKSTNLTKTKFYKEMLENLRNEWKNQESKINYVEITPVSLPNSRNHPVYVRPVLLNDSTIVSEKQSLNDPDMLVRIDRKTGKEQKIITLGSTQDGTLSAGGSLIVWSEVQPDARWQNRDFSVVRIHNVINGTTHSLTRKSRYFAPSLSPDHKWIVAVKTDLMNIFALDVLNAGDGQLVKQIPFGSSDIILYPEWSPDCTTIAVVVLNEKGKCLATVNVASGKVTYITPFTFTDISIPAFNGNRNILFNGDYSGIGNIFAIDITTHKISQVTSSQFYSGNPASNSPAGSLVCSDYNSDGLRIVEVKTDSTKWIPLENVKNQSILLYETIVNQEHVNIQDSVLHKKIFQLSIADTTRNPVDTLSGKFFSSKKYNKFLHLFNPHSWQPLNIDVNNLQISPGVSVLSQNTLGSMIASAGWAYNTNESTGKIYLNLSYQALYPVFDLGIDYGNRASYYISRNNETVRYTWKEANYKLHASIPWNFSRGRYYRYLTPSAGTSIIDIIHNTSTPTPVPTGLIPTLDYALGFSQYLRSAVKDVYPRFGQVIYLNFRNTPFKGNQMGDIFAAQGYFYFPGIFKHHGIFGYCAYQAYHPVEYSFYTYSTIINFPRGTDGIMDEQVISLSANYKLPLFYPDVSLGSVAYIKRFKLNLFYDWAEGITGNRLNSYASTGCELTADLHLLRFLYPFELGVRGIYFPLSDSWGWEFLYSVSFR